MSNGLPCIPLGDPPPRRSITFPGGAVIETPPIFRPHDRLIALEALFASLAPAMAALSPFFTLIEVVAAIIDMVKAVATLNPAKILAATAAFIQATDKLLALIPQVSLPLFIVGVLQLVLDLLATMIDFLQSIQQQQAQIDAMKEYAQREGFDRMLEDALCLEENLETQLEYFNNGLGALAAFLALVEGLASIAGIDLSIDVTGDDGESTQEAIDRLAGIVDTITTIVESIPLP